MMNEAEILAEYKLVANGATGHPQSLPSPLKVIQLVGHFFIYVEVEFSGRAFLLRLAEAYPSLSLGKLVDVKLQTQAQIEKQVRDFVDRRNEDAA
jgi:hypothetical protein